MQFHPDDHPIPVTGARVEQLSTVLAVSDEETTERLEQLGLSSNKGRVDDAAVRVLLADVAPRRPREELGELIERAFLVARNSGKADWRTIQVSVLKNRLISVSERHFDEADYGYPNLHYLVRAFPDKLDVIESPRYATVQYIGEESSAPAEEPAAKLTTNVPGTQPARSVVRADLWSGVLDYKSGQTYVWRPSAGLALRAEPVEGDLLFPTVDASQLGRWRNDFVATLELEPEESKALRNWAETTGATGLLAPRYRGLWNGFLRSRVIERVSAFFVANDQPLPQDLISSRARAAREPSTPTLRSQLHSILDLMSDQELDSVAFPAQAWSRYLSESR